MHLNNAILGPADSQHVSHAFAVSRDDIALMYILLVLLLVRNVLVKLDPRAKYFCLKGILSLANKLIPR